MDTTFIDELAWRAPHAWRRWRGILRAVASALASMVGNLTVGKKTYAAVEDDVRATLERLRAPAQKLLRALIESDAQAFEPTPSYRMPKARPRRRRQSRRRCSWRWDPRAR